MNDTVQVCRFDAEPLGSLGAVACQSTAFFQQCLDVHWTAGLLGLSPFDEIVNPPVIVQTALGAVSTVSHERRNRESQCFYRSAHVCAFRWNFRLD
jgi:hypothetical protein